MSASDDHRQRVATRYLNKALAVGFTITKEMIAANILTGDLVDNKWPMAWYQEYNKAWTLAHLKRRKERGL